MKSVIAVCGLACVAAAEPVVVRLPEAMPSVPNLQAFDDRFPPVSLGTYQRGGGAEILTYSVPAISMQNDSCSLLEAAPGEVFLSTDVSAHPYIELVTGVQIGPDNPLEWGPADLPCTSLDPNGYGSLWSPILAANYGFACDFDCPQTYTWDLWGSSETIPDGVYYIPIRYAGKEGEAIRYGWIAFRLSKGLFDDECAMDLEPFCPPSEPEYDAYTYLGAAIETDAGVPIVLGAGLCEADLSPDGVLDLSDIQAFTEGFIGLDPIADLTGDGVFDLADIQAFISAFTTGCGVL